jgi:hypothetical protein
MTNAKRQAILEQIKSSIDLDGFHVRVVEGGPLPRFAYTIGLYERFGFELVFAGGAFFQFDETLEIINALGRNVLSGATLPSFADIGGFGRFSFQDVEESWGQKILLGALDYFGLKQIKSFQIIPDEEHLTVDTPRMQEPWDSAKQPIWKWLEDEWSFQVSPKAMAITNLDALKGHPVTEVMRWEADEWELFAGSGPDTKKSDIRTVPIGIMLAYDPTLEPVVNLAIDSGLWRDDKGQPWHDWGKQS